MDHNQQKYWDNVFSHTNLEIANYDNWLDQYLPIMKQAHTVVDLGCGGGVDTLFLSANGINTIACDFSQNALNIVKKRIPDASVLEMDMTQAFPFSNESVDVFISDLSLHYFSDIETKGIVSEIWRVLKQNGSLFLRVNAFESEVDYTQYRKIEEDYYCIDGCMKRLFSKESIKAYFSKWVVIDEKESITEKYNFAKKVIICWMQKFVCE